MNCKHIVYFLVVILAWGSIVYAADEPLPVLGQQGIVLGQPPASAVSTVPTISPEAGITSVMPAAPETGPVATLNPTPVDVPKKPDVQALFQESLRQMMPLDDNQIQEYRKHSDQRERALLPVSPALNSRTVRVSLEPGTEPVRVFATANIATSLLIHDVTGQPWPITSVTNGGPSFFQVLRPELPDGNLLNIMPTQSYGTTTIVVTLDKKDIPLVIRLEADSVRGPERKADALVLFQIAQFGPKAKVPVIADIKETVSSSMLAFLDQVPPSGAIRLNMEPKTEHLTVWKLDNTHYIRTSHSLMWPAWTAVVHGAGTVKCYETPMTPRIMLSQNGAVQTIVLTPAPQNEVQP